MFDDPIRDDRINESNSPGKYNKVEKKASNPWNLVGQCSCVMERFAMPDSFNLAYKRICAVWCSRD